MSAPLADQPAFPNVDKHGFEFGAGLTKREYFAALAMQANLSNSATVEVLNKTSKDAGLDAAVFIAKISVYQADELCAELEKKK